MVGLFKGYKGYFGPEKIENKLNYGIYVGHVFVMA